MGVRLRIGRASAVITPPSDVAPVINDQSFSVLESAADNSAVGTVAVANSPSPAPAFSITGGNTGTTFAINSSTGAITVIEPGNLVADADYTLTITASNTAGSDTASVTVAVNDADVLDMTPIGDLNDKSDESFYRFSYDGAVPTVRWTPAELIAAGLVMPLTTAGVMGLDHCDNTGVPMSYTYTPGSLDYYYNDDWSGPADRPELGVHSVPEVQWMLGITDEAPMLNIALACGAAPIYVEHPDGQIINNFDYPMASVDDRNDPDPLFDIYDASQPVTPDSGHFNTFAYIPWLATRHPVYLYQVQCAAAFSMLNNGPWDYLRPETGVIVPEQTRAAAWLLRNFAHAYLGSPASISAPFLPKSHWKELLDVNRDEILDTWVNSQVCRPFVGAGDYSTVQSFVANTGVILMNGEFNNGGNTRSWSPWHADYLGNVLGFMVNSGQLDDWDDIFEFSSRQVVQRFCDASTRHLGVNYGDGHNGVGFPNFGGETTMNGYLNSITGWSSGAPTGGHGCSHSDLFGYRSEAYAHLTHRIKRGMNDTDTMNAYNWIVDELEYFNKHNYKYAIEYP